MLYAMLCYNAEEVVATWPGQKDQEILAARQAICERLNREQKFAGSARLMPTTTAVTVRAGREHVVLDGPFAETREQLLGFYLVDCASLEEALALAHELVSEGGAIEVRPLRGYRRGALAG